MAKPANHGQPQQAMARSSQPAMASHLTHIQMSNLMDFDENPSKIMKYWNIQTIIERPVINRGQDRDVRGRDL